MHYHNLQCAAIQGCLLPEQIKGQTYNKRAATSCHQQNAENKWCIGRKAERNGCHIKVVYDWQFCTFSLAKEPFESLHQFYY